MTRISRSEEETMRVAARVAASTRAGTVICLRGPLGAGKTTFVRGFLRRLGHRGRVPSPTFALVNEYPRLKPRVYHLDLYRVEAKELGLLALEEYLGDPRAVSLIEWPEAAESVLPARRVEVRFAYAPRGRKIAVRECGRKR